MIDIKASPSIDDNPNCADWLDLSQDGKVLLRTGKVEIGQGILTALVQIAADELDISPDRFEVLSGHTRLGPLEGQTSSSLSLEVSGRAIRLAASATRKRLAEEAATLLQAKPEDIAFEDGAVRVSDRETPLTSWTLAQTVELNVPVMDHAAPKSSAARRVIGTSLPRRDLPAKATGAPFIQDLALDGMKHGRVLQPPSQTSRVVSFDSDALATKFHDVKIIRNGSFIGVIADREEIAIKAIEVAGQLTQWDDGASVPADIVEAVRSADGELIEIANAGNASANSDRKVTISARKAFYAHGSIAPSCAIATWQEGHLEVYSHTQGPHGLRDALGIVFGIEPLANVTVIHKPGAGTYGHSGQDDVACDAALLAKEMPGTPVRVIWSRSDDFVASPLGPGMVVDGEATIADDGRLVSLAITSHSQPHAQRPGRGGVAGLTSAELIDPPFPWVPNNDVPPERGGGADRNATPLYQIP
ncbi:MAG: molybdopterin cofactor-binding domain-containing protein, partial [Pseudomonadota bacterium]